MPSFAIARIDGASPENSLCFHLCARASALMRAALGRGCMSVACPGGITSRISPEHSFSRAGMLIVNSLLASGFVA
jgi:hypothetical protein